MAVKVTNVNQDSSANAGAAGATALGANASLSTTNNLESTGRDKISVGAGANVNFSDTTPETVIEAFKFGRDALAAVSANTERQVNGAVDAARQATEATARLAAGDSRNAATYAATGAAPAPSGFTLPKWAYLAGAAAGVLVVILLIRPRK